MKHRKLMEIAMRFAVAALLLGISNPAYAEPNYAKESNRPAAIKCIDDIWKVNQDVLSAEYISMVKYCLNTYPTPRKTPEVSREFQEYIDDSRAVREEVNRAGQEYRNDYKFYQ